jgi:coenzyme F420-dependent glucose-6-phosphate dehydrogenase
MGTAVTAPILRYHPAIVAQAFATIGTMYPGRAFIAIATGEAMNELPLGLKWPGFNERAERLEEAIKIIRKLWTEDFTTFRGKYYRLNKANLYTRPSQSIPIYIAASGPRIAELAGRYADGLLTLPFPDEHYTHVLFPALEKGAKEAGREYEKIEKLMELQMSYDEDYDKALQAARWWAPTVMPIFFKAPISDPREIEAHGKLISEEGLKTGWFISNNIDDHIKNIERYIKLGFSNFHFQSSSPDEKGFIQTFGKKVLPYLRDAYRG